jgi:hypothetical protein
MKQPHTETSIKHTDGQQDTGNHKKPGTADAGGADRFGGTRAGAENVERPTPEKSASDKAESVESGTDVSKVSGLDEVNASEKSLDDSVDGTGHVARAPERDERGRM